MLACSSSSSSSPPPPPLTSASSSESVSSVDELRELSVSPRSRMHLSLPPPVLVTDALPTPKIRPPKRSRVASPTPVPPAWADAHVDGDADDEADASWPSFSRLSLNHGTTHPSRPPLGSRRSTAMPPSRTPTRAEPMPGGSGRKHSPSVSSPALAFSVSAPTDNDAWLADRPRAQSTPALFSPPLFTPEDAAALATPGAWNPLDTLPPDCASLAAILSDSSAWKRRSTGSDPLSPTRSRFDDMADRSATDWRGGLARFRAPAHAPQPAPTEAPIPQAPRVLTPPPRTGAGGAHERFLCHAPPPPEAGIMVEALAGRYRVRVRLPGTPLGGVTLSARTRQRLHIAADGYEAGGGHFERRIQFGPDADLNGVSAEFAGGVLDVSVPRREMAAGGGWCDWSA